MDPDKDSELQESKNEEIKRLSQGLRGNLAEELVDKLPSFSAESEQILKFHGIYNQDNRDVRAERKKAGLDIEHICMIRLAIPGGRLTAEQYLAADQLSDLFGKESLRVTTRQGLQFHFVSKENVKSIISSINKVLVTTYAGCGDVVRNVTACPSPEHKVEELKLGQFADQISKRYKPKSSAYIELWIDGENHSNEILIEDEPIYGVTYLPRKFKIGIAPSSDNCIDVFSCDLALVVDEANPQQIKVFVGGGLGRAHADSSTRALLAKPLTEISRDNVFEVIDAIIALQRDHGDRKDRSHARFKYLVDEWGIDKIHDYLSNKLGYTLPKPVDHQFKLSADHLGWINQGNESWALGVKVPSGRITDNVNGGFKSGFREVVKRFDVSVRFTAKEDVILTGIAPENREDVLSVLSHYGIELEEKYSSLSRFAFACPALPTCGLALAESERFLPSFLKKLEETSTELGIDNFDAEVRMTGCPNGCARPYLGEIGIVGRSKRSYDIYLGADRVGNRLGEVYAQDVLNDNLAESLKPILSLYQKEGHSGEGFGDFCFRYGMDSLRKYAPEPRRKRVPIN